ncbi:MAG: carboxypeptidase [Bacteroidetes bacterium QS_8_68_15]|nr:MAG: carboxypeptidase [Bacteroidetes bacterium QS_8_68_15]
MNQPTSKLRQLKAHLAEAADLEAAAAVLSWDQETFMPEGGAAARSRQLSTLQRLAHRAFTRDDVGALLDDLAPQFDDDDPLSNDDAALVRVAQRDYERKRKLPSDLVARLAQTASEAKEAWKAARAEDDFDAFAPHLRRLVELNREKAEAIGYGAGGDATPYDALLDEYEPGARTADVAPLFEQLRDDLVPLVNAIGEAEPVDDACLRGEFAPDVQQAAGEEVIRAFGYDFGRGRQDRSAHPFTTSFSTGDVRLTTRFDPQFFGAGFFATLHEAGHGLYEQGVAEELERTPLAEGASLGLHESQSRLWENLVGRSRAFWRWYFPTLQEHFPQQLSDVSEESFYRAANRVEPSLIRVEADEVTYNLHVMLRFEIERALIEGRLAVKDLPERWNAAMDDYLGVVPDSDANGVLQDVHWPMGAFGYFPTYTLGTLMSVPLFRQARADLGDLDAQLARGAFTPLREWLREHIHRHGRKLQAADLLERVTGETLSAGPWLNYAHEKFSAIYGL